MILPGSGPEIQRGGIVGEKQFAFSLTAKMYDLVSTNLYSDRIGSTVREVCSNAWDGHKAAGKEAVPFQVTLPTTLEPHFVVEDFGTGMTDERAQELYSTLGLSTKEMTNDMIGAFGLGSKSPFTVTDTFTVENTYNGMTYHYLCFKNEKGFPSILKTGENPTDKINGVKVIIPVAGTKYHDYANAMQRQLIMMEPKPIITNRSQFKFEKANKRLEYKDGFILDNATSFGLYQRGLYAKMGIVVYPIELSQLKLGQGDNYHMALEYNSALILNFDIGELDPLPSREGLTYDNAGKTVKLITERYNAYKQHLIVEGKRLIEAEGTPLKAWKKALELKQLLGIEFRNKVEINGFRLDQPPIKLREKYEYITKIPPVLDDKGAVITAGFDRNCSDYRFKYNKSYRSWRRIDTSKNYTWENIDFGNLSDYNLDRTDHSGASRCKTIVVLMDELTPKRPQARMKHFETTVFGEKDSYHSSDIEILWTYVPDTYTGDRTDFSEFIKRFDALDPAYSKHFVKFSDIQAPKVKRDPNKNKEEFKGVNYRSSGSSYFRDMKRTQDYDADETFYLTAERNTLDNYPTTEIKTFSEFSSYSGTDIILVRKSGEKFLKEFEAEGVREFKQFVNESLTGAKFSPEFILSTSVKDLYSTYSHLFAEGALYAFRDLVKPVIRNPNGVKFVDRLLEINQLYLKLENDDLDLSPQEMIVRGLKQTGLYSEFTGAPWMASLEVDVKTEFKQMLNQFMSDFYMFNKLFHASMYSYTDASRRLVKKHIVDMQELIERRNKIVVQPY